MKKFLAWTVALGAVVMALATPAVSNAGWLFNRCQPACHSYSCGYTYNNCGYKYGCYYTPRYYAPQVYAVPAQLPASNTAIIHVMVPDGATVSLGGAQTVAGTDRSFESPPLTPGQNFTYDVKAQWRDQNGRDVIQIRQVVVSANSNVSVDFRPQIGG